MGSAMSGVCEGGAGIMAHANVRVGGWNVSMRHDPRPPLTHAFGGS